MNEDIMTPTNRFGPDAKVIHNSAGAGEANYLSSDAATAYRILIEANEQPWGGTWGVVEDKGTLSVDLGSTLTTRPWYHLWSENASAVRVKTTPDWLEWTVTNVFYSHSILDATGFSAGEGPVLSPVAGSINLPDAMKWKKVTENIGTYLKVKPTITVTAPGGVIELTGNLTPSDIVVNKIAKVEWTPIDGSTNKIKLGTNPTDNGSGERCFPEKDSPDGTVNDQIDAKVSLTLPVPPNMWGTVHLAWFDPKNPKGSLKTLTSGNNKANTIRDNHGTVQFVNSPTLTFQTATNVQYLPARLKFVKDPVTNPSAYAAHAGDNYIVAAHPNSGVANKYRFQSDDETLERPVDNVTYTVLDPTNPKKLQTEKLTVWRTLWMELDKMVPSDTLRASMPYQNVSYQSTNFDTYVWNALGGNSQLHASTLNPSAYNELIVVLGVSQIIGVYAPQEAKLDLATQMLKAACVDIKPLSGQHNYRSEIYFAATIDASYNGVSRQKVIADNYNGTGLSGQDATQNNDTFWKIHTVGAYAYNKNYLDGETGIAGRLSNGGVLFIFNKTIDVLMSRSFTPSKMISPYIVPDDFPNPNIPIQVQANYRSRVPYHETLHYFTLKDRMDDPNAEGIMDYFTLEFQPDTKIELTPNQIRTIQKQPKPTPPTWI